MTTPQTPPADAVARLTKLADDYASRGDFATEDDIRTLLAAYADAARDRERMDFLINETQFDSIGGLDVHEAVDAIARRMGRPVTVDEYPKLYMQAYRNIIDAARTGEAR